MRRWGFCSSILPDNRIAAASATVKDIFTFVILAWLGPREQASVARHLAIAFRRPMFSGSERMAAEKHFQPSTFLAPARPFGLEPNLLRAAFFS